MNTRIPLAVGALLLAAGLAACSSPAPEPAPATSPTADAAEPVKTPAPQPSDTPEAAEELTCATLISKTTTEALTAQGWTTQEKDFWISDIELTDGLLCMWADFSTASDHGQTYGFSPLDEATSEKAQQKLEGEGWIRSADASSVFYTEDPEHAIATDEDGFGLTYEFGEGWVKFADTKQGLILINAG